MNFDRKKIVFILSGLVLITIVWVLVGQFGITTKEVSTKIISGSASQLTSSEDGEYAYVSDNTLHLVLKTSEEKIINNFSLYSLGLSQNGSYLSASDGDSCQIISTSSTEVVKQEERCSSVTWASDSGYYFFRDNGDSSEETTIEGEPDYSDDTILNFTDLTTNQSSVLPDISIDNLVSLDWTSKKILISSNAQQASTVCSINEADYTLIENCVEVEGVGTSIKQLGDSVYLELNKGSAPSLAKLENGNTKMLGASIRFEKTSNLQGAFFALSESNPSISSVFSLDPENKKAPKVNITGKRFHGVKKIIKVNENKFLVLADNGLWEVEL